MDELFNDWEKYSRNTLSKSELDTAYGKLRRKIDKPARQRKARLYALAIAAALCIIIAPFAGIKVYKSVNETCAGNQLCHISTHDGESKTVTLPDGSTVMLNAGSVLIYPEAFNGSSRSVYLTGEAKFDVVRDEIKSFEVNTIDFVIRVHGTSFNVNSYVDSRVSSATLCSGSISAQINETGKIVGMMPDQCLVYDRVNKTYELSCVDSHEWTAWIDGDICFQSESIHNIVKNIERSFGVNIYITSGKYDDARITAKFLHGETLDEVMTAICRLVPGMKYIKENSNVYLK